MRRLAVVLFAVLSVGGCCVWSVWPYRTLGTLDLGSGYALQVFTEYDHFDLDSTFPVIHYRVTRGSTEVVPKTWLGLHRGQQYRFRVAVTGDGQLACVYDEFAPDDYGGHLMFDLPTGESYPRHRFYDEASRPIPEGRWLDRYRRLREDNPDLPKVRWFEDGNGQ